MSIDPDSYVLLLFAALIPVMVLVALVFSWVDKRWGNRERDPAGSALNRLKYASIIAVIALFVLVMRLPGGAHVLPSNATEQLQQGFQADLDRMREVISFGFGIAACWFTVAYGALKDLFSKRVNESV